MLISLWSKCGTTLLVKMMSEKLQEVKYRTSITDLGVHNTKVCRLQNSVKINKRHLPIGEGGDLNKAFFRPVSNQAELERGWLLARSLSKRHCHFFFASVRHRTVSKNCAVYRIYTTNLPKAKQVF